jgi:hypothetical protein
MSRFDPKFAIAAAHNITPRTIRSWSPKLVRSPRAMVPIQLDALVVRVEAGTWADCTFKTPPKDAPPARGISNRDLLPAPFANKTEPRKPGVYLHWALPDALTHGVASKDETTVSFPAIPNRWLVMRLHPSTNNNARRAVRGWVLRAGDEKPRHVELDSWIEDGKDEGPIKKPLTALGHGDPAWAAYFDNVENRLAFYDDLRDVASGPLAYLVCGWFTDPALDPLGAETHSLTDFHTRMRELNWELDKDESQESTRKASALLQAAALLGLETLEAATPTTTRDSSGRRVSPLIAGAGSVASPLNDAGVAVDGFYTSGGEWWPKQTIYHGAVVGIGWPGIGFPGADKGLLQGEVGGPPPASAIKVVLGNTMAEALGTLVAQTNNAPDQARILEAFMLGGLNDLDQPDGPARIDALLHASAFGSLSGGETTETIIQPPVEETPPLPLNPGNPEPGVFKSRILRETVFEVVEGRALSEATVNTNAFSTAERFRESRVLNGRLDSVLEEVKPREEVQPEPPKEITVKRSLPRRFFPSDPVILLQGARRAFKHGHDGRFSPDGRLTCRLSGSAINELSSAAITTAKIRPSVRGDDVLERGVENGSVPPECEELLRELVLLDPSSAVSAARATRAVSDNQVLRLAENLMVEQTAWWATRDPRIDHAPLVALSGLAGTLPSPIAFTPPVRPWTPLHLDWQIQYVSSPGDVQDWVLDESEYRPKEDKLPSPDDSTSGVILSGRALLTSGAAATIASGVRKAFDQAKSAGGAVALSPAHFASRFNSTLSKTLLSDLADLTIKVNSRSGDSDDGGIDRTSLADIASTLEHMDVLAGAFDSFHASLRGGFVGDGVSKPPGGGTPAPFVSMRAGFMRILRLRLVDCFGQVVDLAGSNETTTADASQITKSQPVQVRNRQDISAMPPRFTSPARLSFRFMDASGLDREANTDISPVCGYLLPNHLDGDLDFYNADGNNLGEVRPEAGAGVVWEEPPGQPSTLGQTPARAISNQFLAGIAQGLIDWGVADASLGENVRELGLSAILRIIDSTLWSVDPFGHTGDEHLALLIGHPIAVLRAKVRLEVEEPIDATRINVMKVALRLGALAHWQDGLLGYFINDDYRTLYCADAAVAGFARQIGPRRGFLQPINQVPNFYERFANDIGVDRVSGDSPVDHPYVNTSGVLEIIPNQEMMVTLLVEPHTVVHATTGLLPRKEIGMRREWVAEALEKIAPTFRFGPVLVDPKRIRMPVASELNGSWTWSHRTDITTWAEDRVIKATNDALLLSDPSKGQEGWLRLTFKEES